MIYSNTHLNNPLRQCVTLFTAAPSLIFNGNENEAVRDERRLLTAARRVGILGLQTLLEATEEDAVLPVLLVLSAVKLSLDLKAFVHHKCIAQHGEPVASDVKLAGLKKRKMSSSLPVAAVCQTTATPDKEANFSTCTRLVEQAKEGGASMVFLPEGFDYIGSNREETLALSETLDGDIITRYTHLARKLDVWLSLGGFHERGHDWKTDRRIYNSHIIINGQGEIVSVYRKGHLFDVELTSKGVSLKESAFTVPGPRLLPPVQTPIGKVGLGVCYDLRFPELSSALQRHGAEILTYPSAFTVATGAAHWEVLLRARAIETQCFVLAAAQVGAHHAKRTSYGHALAVDPWGVVLGDCGGSDVGVTLVQIDLQALQDIRRDMPVQQHRREKDFYSSLD